MATPVAAPLDIIQVRFVCYSFDQVGENVLTYRVQSVVAGGVGLDVIAAKMSTDFSNIYRPMLATVAEYLGCGVRCVFPVGRKSLEYVDKTGAGAGTAGTANELPRQTSLVITKQTDFPGRKNRGRLYIPFPSANAAGGTGLPTTPYVTAAAGLATQMLAVSTAVSGGSSSTLWPCLLHKGTGIVIDLTAARVNEKFGTMKKRGSYGRPNIRPF